MDKWAQFDNVIILTLTVQGREKTQSHNSLLFIR